MARLGLAQEPLLHAAVTEALARAHGDGHNPIGHGQLLHVETPGPRGTVARHVAVVLADAEGEVALLRPADEAAALFDMVASVPFAFAILNMFLTNPYQAITVADHEGLMRYISPVHEFFGLAPGTAAGRRAEDVIPNSRLPHVARSGRAEIGDLQQLGPGVSRIVNRMPVYEGGAVVGAVGQVSFSGVEALNRMQQRLNQLHDEVQHYKRELSQLRGGTPTAQMVGASAPCKGWPARSTPWRGWTCPCSSWASGSGKELVAQALHARGRDADAPLVSLNLAALPATLIESELFGYEAGAFTGGRRQGQPGKLEQAEGGTLFLDEVADIPMEIQVKLLRVLEDRQVQRLGAHSGRQVNFRIVAATHRDLRGLIDSGRFRLDLFYRLSGVVLHVPALRQRLEDIRPWCSALPSRSASATALRCPASRPASCPTWPGRPGPAMCASCDSAWKRPWCSATASCWAWTTSRATRTRWPAHGLRPLPSPACPPPAPWPRSGPGAQRHPRRHRTLRRQQETGRAGAGHLALLSVQGAGRGKPGLIPAGPGSAGE